MATKNTAPRSKYADAACGKNHSGSHDLVWASSRREDAECVGCLSIYTRDEIDAATGRPNLDGRLYDPRG